MEEPATGTIDIEKDGAVWVVTLRGEHDRYTAPRLGDALDSICALCAGPGTQPVGIVVDLTLVDFMDSSIISALVLGRAIAKREPSTLLAVAAPSASAGAVDRILTLSGVPQVIPTYASRELAVAALSPEVTRWIA